MTYLPECDSYTELVFPETRHTPRAKLNLFLSLLSSDTIEPGFIPWRNWNRCTRSMGFVNFKPFCCFKHPLEGTWPLSGDRHPAGRYLMTIVIATKVKKTVTGGWLNLEWWGKVMLLMTVFHVTWLQTLILLSTTMPSSIAPDNDVSTCAWPIFHTKDSPWNRIQQSQDYRKSELNPHQSRSRHSRSQSQCCLPRR